MYVYRNYTTSNQFKSIQIDNTHTHTHTHIFSHINSNSTTHTHAHLRNSRITGQDSTTCDNVTYMKNENKGETIPGSSNSDPTIGDFIEITVCTARDDLNSTSCSPSCTLNPRTVSCTKCSECLDRESCRALNAVSNRSRDQTFVGESSVQINDETDICIWYGTDDTGYCGPYGLTGSCNVYQTDQFCRGALIGTKWCDLCTDGANCAGSQSDTSPDANGGMCNQMAHNWRCHRMVKCKSAWENRAYRVHQLWCENSSITWCDLSIKSTFWFGRLSHEYGGYVQNVLHAQIVWLTSVEREFYCCRVKSDLLVRITHHIILKPRNSNNNARTQWWCCDTDECKHLGSKQCGGNGSLFDIFVSFNYVQTRTHTHTTQQQQQRRQSYKNARYPIVWDRFRLRKSIESRMSPHSYVTFTSTPLKYQGVLEHFESN